MATLSTKVSTGTRTPPTLRSSTTKPTLPQPTRQSTTSSSRCAPPGRLPRADGRLVLEPIPITGAPAHVIPAVAGALADTVGLLVNTPALSVLVGLANRPDLTPRWRDVGAPDTTSGLAFAHHAW